MTSYMVEAKSRKEIRSLVRVFRQHFNIDDCLYFPIVELLDVLAVFFPDYNYEIVEDNELPADTHADTDITTGNIRIKQTVYDRACAGEGRDRMTIAHEIGHYFMLKFCGFKLERNFSEKNVDTCRDPEWQAKCFAGELLVPAHLVNGMTQAEISVRCGVSLDAAGIQHKKLKKG